ncbi:MAG TPA: FecR domain-containing protein [Rhizomicrobium sp.]|nr:FecR domain-containing protein [Rhizomicrobium sp.]
MTDANTKQVRMEAAGWLERRQRPEWNAEDQSALDAWLAADPAHMVSYLRVEAAWNRANRLGALRQPMRASNAAQAPRRSFTRFLNMAAAVIGTVAVVGGIAATYMLMPEQKSYTTQVGGHEILALKDGSQIELNTSTVVRVSQNKGERKVWLDKGEAYFRIKHDAAHPFVVMVGGHRVTDLGTTFLVRRDKDSVKVALIEGLAQFDGGTADGQHAMLKPGDVVVASAKQMSLKKEDTGDLATGLGWRHGLLIFKYTTLADAAAEFNRYNDRKLVIADPAVGRLKIVGTFATNNVAAFADVAEDVLHLKVTHSEDQIVIAR